VAAEPFTKNYADANQHVALLVARGMQVEDAEKAQLCLRRIGYYRLSAYWYPFRKLIVCPYTGRTPVVHRFDEFIPGTSFDEVVDFYVFDKELRILLLDALERIEIALRSNIADHLGARSKWAHREPSELHGNFTTKPSSRARHLTRHQDWLNEQDRNFERSREDFAVHYRDKYLPPPPIWVAKEVWDWGMLSHFFSGMKYVDKNAIAAQYSPQVNGDNMASWIRAMNDVRNICAHHSRLWNRGLKVEPTLPKGVKVPDLDHIRGNTHSLNRLYGAALVMRYIMRKLHPKSQWHVRFRNLVLTKAPTNPIIDQKSAGFPNGWEALPIWR
jgi:abortive infection bacteriophage resistance protein